MTTRRKFLQTAGVGAMAAPLATPAIAQSTITWRMQTYAGAALAEHVAKPAIDMFNKIAGDRMQIELFYADQLVPTGELFRALQRGTIDAVQSDDDSMASPTEVTVFGGYFPFGCRYSLDVPVLFNDYGLDEIWKEEYAKVGVQHISAGSWDPCHFATKDPIRSLADLEGKRVGIAQAGSGTQVAVLQMLEKWGITRDNIDEAELNNSQSAERLADGQLDAYFYAAGWPVSAMVQLATTKGMELHSFSDEDLAIINEAVPAYIPSAIPAGVYEGIDYEVKTPAVSALLNVSSDLDEELVYGITKALWNDNTRNLLDNGHAKGKQITPDTALDGVMSLGVPLHPGAERFYKEAGLLE